METNTSKEGLSNQAQNWIITLFVIFISLGGLTLALICIYSLPDKSVQPLAGSVFFSCASIVVIGLLFYCSTREKNQIIRSIKEFDSTTSEIVIREGISDKIIKLIVTIFSVFFVFWSFTITLICIYALPDKTVQPVAGTVYFCCGAIVLGMCIFVVWKNWATKKS